MAIPVYVVGQVLPAADVNTWFLPRAAVKPSDQTVTSSTVLVNDTALVVAVDASATYEVFTELFWTPVAGGAVPGMSLDFAIPAGATMIYRVISASGPPLSGVAGTPGTGFNANSAGTYSILSIHGVCVVAGTAGNLQFKWAQSTSSGTSTVVKANSFISARRIS